ncbi:hypothetical protein OG216_27405 [Streptomycetaceae bacterium NBC_01309]
MRIRLRRHVTRCQYGGVHIGRWMAYRESGALHIERGADPNCRDCNGAGMWWDVDITGEEADPMPCGCTDGPRLRIPYRPRRKTAPGTGLWFSDEPPF